jgi:hypothetical protein
MKKLPFLLCILFASMVSAQQILKSENATDHSVHIVGSNFEGVIFSKKYFVNNRDTLNYNFFTPTTGEIELTEKILNQRMNTVKDSSDQITLICKDLPSYIRQYSAYINANGERIIKINALKKSTTMGKGKKIWLKEIYTPWDGGYLFWRIKVNLGQKMVFDFNVNGV